MWTMNQERLTSMICSQMQKTPLNASEESATSIAVPATRVKDLMKKSLLKSQRKESFKQLKSNL